MDLNAYRNNLARIILATESMEVLEAVENAYCRAVDENVCRGMQVEEERAPYYTMEELNARLDEAEAEQGGTPSETFFSQLEREMPWLCK